MASNDESSGGDGSWWGSLIKQAKEKSFTAYEMIKTDLAEFKTTMTNDTSHLINQATNQLKETTNQSIFNSLSTTFISSQDNDDDDINKRRSSESNKPAESKKLATRIFPRTNSNKKSTTTTSTIHDRYKQELESLQANDQTFLTDPVVSGNSSQSYSEWQENFNPDNYKSAIGDLLIQNSSLRLIYSQLVPAQMSNVQFWSRYFFKVNHLEEEHKKRVKLLERATDDSNKNEVEETFDWDEEDEETNKEVKTIEKSEIEIEKAQPAEIKPVASNVLSLSNEDDSDQNDVTLNNENEINQIDSTPPLPPQTQETKEIETNIADVVADATSKDLGEIAANEESNTLKIKDLSIVEIEASQKTEDSDEWEKVSDTNSNENDAKEAKVNDKALINPVIISESETKDNTNKKPENSSNDAEWDDWDD